MTPAQALRVAVVPPVPALLPCHAGLDDPVADLRRVVRATVRDLLVDRPSRVVVLHDPADPANVERGVRESLGARVARHLLGEAGLAGEVDCCEAGPPPDPGACLVVMANGSARRGEKAPGHLDERSFAFDEQVEAALRSGDGAALRAVDAGLGEELMAAGTVALQQLGALLARRGAVPVEADLRWSGDPWGVQYWVALLTTGPGPGAGDHPSPRPPAA